MFFKKKIKTHPIDGFLDQLEMKIKDFSKKDQPGYYNHLNKIVLKEVLRWNKENLMGLPTTDFKLATVGVSVPLNNKLNEVYVFNLPIVLDIELPKPKSSFLPWVKTKEPFVWARHDLPPHSFFRGFKDLNRSTLSRLRYSNTTWLISVSWQAYKVSTNSLQLDDNVEHTDLILTAIREHRFHGYDSKSVINNQQKLWEIINPKLCNRKASKIQQINKERFWGLGFLKYPVVYS